MRQSSSINSPHVTQVVFEAGANDPRMLAGVVDPSAGAGVEALEGSIYSRYVNAAGAVWYKSGVADAAWTELSGGGGVSDLQGAYDGGAVIAIVAGTPSDMSIDAAGEVFNDGLLLSNDEPATNVLDQYPPTLRFKGNYWDTANTQVVEVEQRLDPFLNTPINEPGMSWYGRRDGGAWGEIFSFRMPLGDSITVLSTRSTNYWSFGGQTGGSVTNDTDICYKIGRCNSQHYFGLNTVNTIDCEGTIIGNGFNTQGADDGYVVGPNQAGWYFENNSIPDTAMLTTPAVSNAIVVCENAQRNNIGVFNGGVAYTHPTILIFENTETDHTEFAHGLVKTSAGDLFLDAVGNVKFGTHAAIGAETVTGSITIRDAAGTLRKLAVVS